jgi:hypothetical protein
VETAVPATEVAGLVTPQWGRPVGRSSRGRPAFPYSASPDALVSCLAKGKPVDQLLSNVTVRVAL